MQHFLTTPAVWGLAGMLTALAAAAAAAGVESGSGKSKTEKVGKVTRAQVEVRGICFRFAQLQ
jgi:hypothetical protein